MAFSRGSAGPSPTNRASSSAERTARSLAEYRSRSGAASAEHPGASVAFTALRPVFLGFIDAHPLQRALEEMGMQALPERQRQVFRRRDPVAEPRDIGIQVSMIDVLDDLVNHQVLQALQVHQIASGGADRSPDDHLENVIVAVQVHALAIKTHVLALGEPRVRELVGGVEALPPADPQPGGAFHAWLRC